MSIESRSRQYGKVFDHWQIKEFLGSGSGGKTAVFRLVRSDSTRGVSALKVVNLIEVRGDINNLSEFRRKEYETARDECSQNAEQEVWLMDDLRGNTNIVDYLDHTFVDWSDETGFGRDLLIRMELLKDLRSELQNGRIFSEMEALKIGRDICIALVRCHRKNILHRDVKPENIFRNKDGDYKLGDFGVSKVLDACPGAVASTGIGTYEYWPAEQMTGRYDKRVDVYSLGLVLYELCNQNHLPFASSTYATSKEVSMRLSGTPLPEPSNASPMLAQVILKACAFDPDERYQSAEELLKALNRVIRSLQGSVEQKAVVIPQEKAQQNTEYATLPAGVSDAQVPASGYKTMPAGVDGQSKRTSFSTEPAKRKFYATEPAEKYTPRYAKQDPVNKKKNNIPKVWIALALLGVCMMVFSIEFLLKDNRGEQNPDEKNAVLQSEIAEGTVVNTVESTAESTDINMIESEPLDKHNEIAETTATALLEPIVAIDANWTHVVALRADGTVSVAVEGNRSQGQDDTNEWKDIISVAAGYFHTVGLKADGTVVAVGNNYYGQCDVSQWSDIVEISAGDNFTVGLKSDGTVIATGDNQQGQCNVSALRDIVHIDATNYSVQCLDSTGKWFVLGQNSDDRNNGTNLGIISLGAGHFNTVGLLSDGTAKFIFKNEFVSGPLDISSWRDITAISVNDHILGLKSDGTVMAVGKNEYGECDVENWSNIVAVCAAPKYSVGLKADGTVVSTGVFINSKTACDISSLNENTRVKEIETVKELKFTSKRDFYKGDVLNAETLALRAVYENGKEEAIDAGVSVIPTVLNEVGTQSVTVSYGGITQNFNVEVIEFTECDLRFSDSSFYKHGNVNWVLTVNVGYIGNYPSSYGINETLDIDSGPVGDLWESAKNGTAMAMKGDMFEDNGVTTYIIPAVYVLPDDPTFGGDHSITVNVGDVSKTVHFTLIYEGNYSTGTGWKMSNVTWT